MSIQMNKNSNDQAQEFMKLELTRGVTPADIKEKCFQLCVDYLGGIWLNLTIDNIEVKRITSGLTNQLYYCGVTENHRNSDESVPQEVAIRLYQDKHFNSNGGNERLSDTIIALQVSQNNLGPKVYGLFESGQILRYYNQRPFRSDEQKDPKLVRELAQKLAHIHAMDVPLKKTGTDISEWLDDFYNKANNLFDLKSLINECNCETLKKYDLKAELQWLKKTIVEINSPVMFTHVDFRGSNIMVTESDGLVIIDYEYSSYTYRGLDFGTLFAEWDRFWADFTRLQDFPNDTTIKAFIDAYIEESIRLRGDHFRRDQRNTFQHILKETKVFSLVSNMFLVLVTIKSNESMIPGLDFDIRKQLVFVESQYKNYYHLKDKFLKEKAFECNQYN